MREAAVNGDSYSKPVVNLLTNPSAETASAATTVFTNTLLNPNSEGVVAGTTYVRTNLCPNPSSETSAGFAPAGNGLVTSAGVSTANYYVGTQSCLFVLPGGTNSEGWKLPSLTVSPSTTYKVSFYVYVVSGFFPLGQITASDYATNSVQLAGSTPTGSWSRVSATYTTLSTQTTLMPWGIAQAAGTYYLDAILIEQTDQLRPYFDGSTVSTTGHAYAWLGTAHASASTAKCAGTVVRNNLAADPAATTYKATTQPTLGWENSRWTPYSTYSLVTGASDGPISSLTTYSRITCSGVTSNTLGWHISQNVQAASLTPAYSYPVSWSAGTYITLSAWVRTSTGYPMYMCVRFADSSGAFLDVASTGTPAGSALVNTWYQASLTVRVPTGAAYMAVIMNQSQTQSNQVGDTLDATGLLVEVNVASVGAYFDGSTQNNSDFYNNWTGTANASTSLCYAPQLSNWSMTQQYAYAQVYQHTQADASHTVRVRFPANMPAGGWRILTGNIGSPTAFTAGSSTTFLLKEMTSWGSFVNNVTVAESNGTNGIGVMGSITTNTTATTNTVTVTNTASASINAVFYRSLVASTLSTTVDHYYDFVQGGVFAVPYTGAYFDGTTAASGDFTYGWTGTANASASQMNATTVAAWSGNYAQPVYSSEWAASGSKSVRVVANGPVIDSYARLDIWTSGIVAQGKTYTILGTIRQTATLTGATVSGSQDRNIFIDINGGGGGYRVFGTTQPQANAAGTYQHRLTFTVPPVSAGAIISMNIRFYNGHPPGCGDVWWDNIMLVEGVYNGPYIDGDQPGCVWTGTPHASTSKGYPPSPLLINNTWPNSIPTSSNSWQYEAGTGGVVSPSYVTGGGPNNRNYVRYTWTTAATGGPVVGGAYATSWSSSMFPPGQTVTISIWARSSVAFNGALQCYFYPNSSPVALTGSNVTLIPGIWTRVNVTSSIPLGYAIRPYIQFRANTGGSLATVGTTLDVTMAQLTVGSTLVDYTDSGWSYPLSIPQGAKIDTTASSTGIIATNLGATLGSPAVMWYTVYQLNANGTTGNVYPVVVFGDTMNDVSQNTYSTLRYNQYSSSLGTWVIRRTSGAGIYVPSTGGIAYAPGIHVLAYGIDANGYQFLSVNGGSEQTDNTVMQHISTNYQIQSTSLGTHLRTLAYSGTHTTALKAQIVAYLRNKYGA